MVLKLFLPMVVSMVISFIATPIIIKTAHHVGAVDVPKDDRRVHTEPIPRLGGLAIFIASMISLMLFMEIPTTKLMGMVVGSLIVVFMGFVDDIQPIKAKYKFIIQVLAAFVLVFSGFRIEGFSNIFIKGNTIGLDVFLSVPVTIIWIVGITNTVNFIDGLDGLAGGISTIAAFTLAYVAFINGRTETAIITLILAGSCLGFLPYNFNPAKIFMGDTGSLFLGFMLAAISIDGTLKGATALTFILPILALGVPIFDTAFAIVRRLAKKQSPFEADKGHLHHRFLSIGFGQKRAVLSMYLINSLLGVAVFLLINKEYTNAGIVLLITTAMILLPIHKTLKQKENED